MYKGPPTCSVCYNTLTALGRRGLWFAGLSVPLWTAVSLATKAFGISSGNTPQRQAFSKWKLSSILGLAFKWRGMGGAL